ncbi:tetratricopeptide repeat protein [Subsaxibacter sp. CAU 1640]|uniref:tetratricopeptide repeat protein n=1 Tax=Subsaxibacter sp. CAU 1640 TaxID=2933271 RepID=UPI0020047CFA|nr:tetratricopeptide repeat protein [Subsaxibacter sp. CAU 1640]MCK7591916.1 tetratricopeptide repeat protein [Subsaxibacter sp. CAU 1640]
MKVLLFFLLVPLMLLGQSELSDVERMLEQKQFAKAQTTMESYVKNNPNDLKGIELLGDAYGQQQKWDDAITQYKRLVDANPKSANYHYKYGGALGMKALKVSKLKAVGMIGDIKDAFHTAANLDPKHIDARWALVELYIQLPGIVGGSVDKALTYANELEKLSKVDGYLAKGYIYEYDDEPELAEKYYKMAITEGGSMTCYEKLTNFYEKQKQPEKAIANIQANHDVHKRNALHYQIGKVAAEYNVELAKGEQCLHTYVKNYSAADGVPKAWAYYRLAQIYKHKRNKSEALKYIDIAIAELPDIKPFKEEKTAILKL